MLDLTKQEKQTLMNALDVAVKALGLNGAAALLPLAAKIQESMMEKGESETTTSAD